MEMRPRPIAEAKVSSWVVSSIDLGERELVKMEMKGLVYDEEARLAR
jgi:hypothetical protein